MLIETIPAAFEMDEILYELRDHAAGLNAGRWDYLFSIIKNFRDAGDGFVLPDRSAVTMTAPFMRAYSELLVQTCHRRGAFAMGGMAAFIPSRRDAEVNERGVGEGARGQDARGRRRLRRLLGGPPRPGAGLRARSSTACSATEPNQLDAAARRRHGRRPPTCSTLSTDARRRAPRTGVRGNVSVGIRYLESWLTGIGAAAIDNLMEDAATAEISRSQVWQWMFNDATLDTGETVTHELVERIVEEEYAALRDAGPRRSTPATGPRPAACSSSPPSSEEFPDFLTLPAYRSVLASEQR